MQKVTFYIDIGEIHPKYIYITHYLYDGIISKCRERMLEMQGKKWMIVMFSIEGLTKFFEYYELLNK